MNYLPFYPFPHLLFHFFIDKRSICQGNDLMTIGLVGMVKIHLPT